MQCPREPIGLRHEDLVALTMMLLCASILAVDTFLVVERGGVSSSLSQKGIVGLTAVWDHGRGDLSRVPLSLFGPLPYHVWLGSVYPLLHRPKYHDGGRLVRGCVVASAKGRQHWLLPATDHLRLYIGAKYRKPIVMGLLGPIASRHWSRRMVFVSRSGACSCPPSSCDKHGVLRIARQATICDTG